MKPGAAALRLRQTSSEPKRGDMAGFPAVQGHHPPVSRQGAATPPSIMTVPKRAVTPSPSVRSCFVEVSSVRITVICSCSEDMR